MGSSHLFLTLFLIRYFYTSLLPQKVVGTRVQAVNNTYFSVKFNKLIQLTIYYFQFLIPHCFKWFIIPIKIIKILLFCYKLFDKTIKINLLKLIIFFKNWFYFFKYTYEIYLNIALKHFFFFFKLGHSYQNKVLLNGTISNNTF